MNLRTAFTLSLTGFAGLTGQFSAAKAQVIDTPEMREKYCVPFHEMNKHYSLYRADATPQQERFRHRWGAYDNLNNALYSYFMAPLYKAAFGSRNETESGQWLNEAERRKKLPPARALAEIEIACSPS